MPNQHSSSELESAISELVNRISRLENDLDEFRQLLPRYWELHNAILDVANGYKLNKSKNKLNEISLEDIKKEGI